MIPAAAARARRSARARGRPIIRRACGEVGDDGDQSEQQELRDDEARGDIEEQDGSDRGADDEGGGEHLRGADRGQARRAQGRRTVSFVESIGTPANARPSARALQPQSAKGDRDRASTLDVGSGRRPSPRAATGSRRGPSRRPSAEQLELVRIIRRGAAVGHRPRDARRSMFPAGDHVTPRRWTGGATRRAGPVPGWRPRRARACARRRRCRSTQHRDPSRRRADRSSTSSTCRNTSSTRNCSRPAISTMPFTGAPTATSARAAATSSAASGWNRAGGRRTVPSSVARLGDAAEELEELRRADDRVRHADAGSDVPERASLA